MNKKKDWKVFKEKIEKDIRSVAEQISAVTNESQEGMMYDRITGYFMYLCDELDIIPDPERIQVHTFSENNKELLALQVVNEEGYVLPATLMFWKLVK